MRNYVTFKSSLADGHKLVGTAEDLRLAQAAGCQHSQLLARRLETVVAIVEAPFEATEYSWQFGCQAGGISLAVEVVLVEAESNGWVVEVYPNGGLLALLRRSKARMEAEKVASFIEQFLTNDERFTNVRRVDKTEYLSRAAGT